MPLSKGQIIFTIFFILLFVVMLVWAYRADSHEQKDYYKGGFRILLVIILIFLSMAVLVKLL